MATITKRGNLQWQAKVRVKGFPPQCKTFTLRADAERWGKETEIAIERGLFFDRSKAERTTLAELIGRYREEILPTLKGKHLEPALRKIDAAFGSYAVACITSEMVSRYRNERLKTCAASTVKKEINLLSRLLDLGGKEWGVPIAVNPCGMVARPKEPKGRERRLEGDEEERLLKACRQSTSGVELTAIVQVALESGARLGELLKLSWHDVNLTRQTALLRDTKNGEDRTIPLSSRAVAALKSVPRHIVNDRVFWRWSESQCFTKTWRRACQRAGIEGLRFHDLRHEAISRLFEKGLNPMEVASVSGHKTLAMLKRYTYLRAEELARKLG